MHSHFLTKEGEKACEQVLILVVMEDALALNRLCLVIPKSQES